MMSKPEERGDRAPPVTPTPDTKAGDTREEKQEEEQRAPPVAPTPEVAEKPARPD